MSRLPVPFVRTGEARFTQLSSLARALAGPRLAVDEMPEYAELQAIVARMYGLSAEEFAHVLETFPLVNETVRNESLTRFKRH